MTFAMTISATDVQDTSLTGGRRAVVVVGHVDFVAFGEGGGRSRQF